MGGKARGRRPVREGSRLGQRGGQRRGHDFRGGKGKGYFEPADTEVGRSHRQSEVDDSADQGEQ